MWSNFTLGKAKGLAIGQPFFVEDIPSALTTVLLELEHFRSFLRRNSPSNRAPILLPLVKSSVRLLFQSNEWIAKEARKIRKGLSDTYCLLSLSRYYFYGV
jgi:hypothetical protein